MHLIRKLLDLIPLVWLWRVSSSVEIKVGVLLMTEATEPFDLRRTGPALEIGFQEAKDTYGITFNVTYHNYTGFCPKETVIGHMSELYYRDQVQALIGPACSATIIAAGRLAQYLRLPMVTGLGDLVVRDEMDADMYRSLTVLSYNLVKLSGVILMESAPEPFDMRRTGPAVMIAMEDAKTKYNVTFDSVFRNYSGVCPYEPPVGILSELYHVTKIKAVVGPACSQGLMSSGRLAAHLGVPMVTGLGDLVIKNPGVDMFDSMTILSYNLRKLSNSMTAIMNTYNWKHSAILYDQTYVFFDIAGSNLVNDFRLSNTMERPYDIPFIPGKVADYGNLLKEAKAHARVFIIFCNSDMLRVILHRAYQLGMANGDFVFITMELFPSDWLGFYMDFLRGDEMDAAVTKAYESLLILTLRQPDNPEYEAFALEVKRRAKDNFGYEFGPDEKVNYFITAFYDSVIYLAKAYKTHLDQGGDINDGMAVAQKLWNSTFDGITGPVKVDEIGNRVADFDLFDMTSPTTKEFQRVGRFRGATQKYNPTPGISIVWPYGIPVDMPPCGYRGELCIEIKEDRTTTTVIICMVIISITAILIVIILLGYRKIKTEQELGKKTWLIPHVEIQIRKNRLNDSFMSKSYLTLDTSKMDEPDQLFTQTGYCRNQVVAMRKLHLQGVDITRNLAIEFRQMQTVSHANLAKFVGACLEPGFMYLLMEYCPRGSLQDMLQNDSIELDCAFRYSLICDIIKGMSFLHSSPLKVHGQLSSTNCVIDSRFALKLTDYGPRSLLSKDRVMEKGQSDSHFNYAKLLWTAPEHLREAQNIVGSSQKGDVYSFGIILQEIAMRAGPFEGCNLDVAEIIQRLVDRRAGILRPDVAGDGCTPDMLHMMRICWAEEPQDRPTFSELDDTFRKIRAGKTTNIMDNLLQRMANYADNLETLAAERTKAYLEEKQKVEELLHRLLPPTVAKQLESGLSVVPETYDMVTIYFSDIVGFTTLAGMSTPIEVVDLLNDLYTTFDNAINRFNVYKVETIGDAYMCVSGLPERNGNLHVVEICNMSLTILDTVTDFKIRHIPNQSLRVRIGLHSGPVVAGVVGLTMPRYCLFGDTVNTASRMESTSEPLKVQMSSTTKALLDNFPNFTAQERGPIEIKGKGLMTTYWLQDCAMRKESVIYPPGHVKPGCL